MGTKSNPGKFDCYAKAEPDEPIFTLRAKDPLAANMVRLWMALRAGSGVAFAVETFAALVKRAEALDPEDIEKLSEAIACADAMDYWFEERL